MATNQLHIGDIVMSADGKMLGNVKQLGDTCFRIAAKRRRDFWLANSAVQGRDAGMAVLLFDRGRLGDAAVDVEAHAGQHSHPSPPAAGSLGLIRPLFLLGGLAAFALRDPERRKQAIAIAREGGGRLKAKLAERKDARQTTNDYATHASNFASTSTLGSGASSAGPGPGRSGAYEPPAAPTAAPLVADAAARREAVVREVTLAFPAMDLRVAPVAVHNLEGGETETLRFTLDDIASSDVELARIERSSEPESYLANQLIHDLRTQLPPEVDSPAS